MGDHRRFPGFPSSPGTSHIHATGPHRESYRQRRPSAHSPHASRPFARAMPVVIGRPRPASPPPPLPPPKNVKDLEDGHDLGWQWGNRGHPQTTPRDFYPMCTTLASRPPSARRESDESEYALLARRDSSFSAPWAPPTKNVPGYGSGSGAGVLTDEGYGSLSGSSLANSQLHSERHLERQNRKDSAHAYDKQLISSLGWPKTPTQMSTADSTEESPTSRRGSLQSPKTQNRPSLSVSGRSLSVSTDPLSKLNSPLSASKWAPSPHGTPSGLISPGVTATSSRTGSFVEPHPAITGEPRSESGTPTASSARLGNDGDGIGQRVAVTVPQSESNLSLAMSSLRSPTRSTGTTNLRGAQQPKQQHPTPQHHQQQYGPNRTSPSRRSGGGSSRGRGGGRGPPSERGSGSARGSDGGGGGGVVGAYDPIFTSGLSPATPSPHLPPSSSAISPHPPPIHTEFAGGAAHRPAAGASPGPGELAGYSPPSAGAGQVSFEEGLRLQPPLRLSHPSQRQHPNLPRPHLTPSSSQTNPPAPQLLSPRSQDFSSYPLTYTQLPSRGRVDDSPSQVTLMPDKKRKAGEMTSDPAGTHRPSPNVSDRATTARKPNHVSPGPSMASTSTSRMGSAVTGYASSTGFDANALTPGSTLDPLSPNLHAMNDAERMLNIDPGLRTASASTQPPNLASIAAQAATASAQSAGTGGTPEEFSQLHAGTGATHLQPHVHICDCCPKKPKKFDTAEELQAHQAEKQYFCRYCNNRFKNKNEAERHQNSLHLRRQSWSCAALDRNIRTAFHPCTAIPPNTSSSPAAQQQQVQQQQQQYADFDVCGYCGMQFPNDPQPDWTIRGQHLTNVHKFGECNQSKKFFRADHFRQHLKHSHSGQSGKWTNMLESACMREEPPDIPLSGTGSGVGVVGERGSQGPPTLAPHPPPSSGGPSGTQAQAAQQQLQLQQKAQMAAAHVMVSHQQHLHQGGIGAPALSIEQAAALAGASAAGAAPGNAPMAMMGGNVRAYVTMAPPASMPPAVQEANLFTAQPSAADEGNLKHEI